MNEEKILLENRIRQAQYQYYVLSSPKLSDREFDLLWEELERKFPESELLHDIGSDVFSGMSKSRHLMTMGSLNKVNTPDKLKKWISSEGISYPLIMEWKLDGISIELIYEKGVLQTAITRGNGLFGEDITHNVRNMQGVPEEISVSTCPELFSVRGEIVVELETFNTIFAPIGFKNPRNTASGLAKQKEVSDQAKFLSVYSYDIRVEEGFFTKEAEKMEFLHKLGFKVPYYEPIFSEKELDTILPQTTELRSHLSFQVDGLVFKENTIREYELDSTMRPKKQIAFKWEDIGEETTLLDVIWNRTGVTYTPVAILDPVDIDGSTVGRASLANLSLIKELGASINDRVYVTKRGAIIPKIEYVVEKAQDRIPILRPVYCDLCKTQLVIENGDKRLYCPNEDCPGKNEHRIRKWIQMTEAKGFGDALIETILEVGISQILELYATNTLDRVCSATNLKEATIKAFQQLYSKKSMSLERFIAGFDIEGVGEKIIREVVSDKRFNTLEKILAENKKGPSVYESVNQMGRTRAETLQKALRAFGDEMRLVSTFVSIKQAVDSPVVSEGALGSSFSGMNFCITGKLSCVRKDMEEKIRELGGTPVSGVNKNTQVLICNEPDSTSSKMKKAKELGIEIWTEEEFFEKASSN